LRCRVLKQQSDRQPAGKLFPVRGQGLALWAGPGNATRVSPARPRATLPPGPVQPAATKASARRGRGGRWPGALAPGWTRFSVVLWQGRWPLPGCAGRAQAQEVPAFGSGGPCGRHFPGTLSGGTEAALQGKRILDCRQGRQRGYTSNSRDACLSVADPVNAGRADGRAVALKSGVAVAGAHSA
jgi:hypothetical protein